MEINAHPVVILTPLGRYLEIIGSNIDVVCHSMSSLDKQFTKRPCPCYRPVTLLIKPVRIVDSSYHQN